MKTIDKLKKLEKFYSSKLIEISNVIQELEDMDNKIDNLFLEKGFDSDKNENQDCSVKESKPVCDEYSSRINYNGLCQEMKNKFGITNSEVIRQYIDGHGGFPYSNNKILDCIKRYKQ